jgi:hypothetical protein
MLACTAKPRKTPGRAVLRIFRFFALLLSSLFQAYACRKSFSELAPPLIPADCPVYSDIRLKNPLK